MNKLVSIIIPTFNRAHLIGQTLDSIKRQSYNDWECLVVDDQSTDYTKELLQFYTEADERFIFIQRPASILPGANSCRNLGFQKSRGEFINWFDSDDIMHFDKLSIQVSLLLKSDLDMCVCQTIIFENKIDNNLGLRHPNLISEDPLNDFICNKIKWLTQAPLIRRSFLEENDLEFDVNLHQSQEWDYFVRLLDVIDKYCVCLEPLVYLRKHLDSISYSEMTAKKAMSFFLARYKALEVLKLKLNDSAKKVLKDQILWVFITLLRLSAFEDARVVKSYVKKMDREYSLFFRYFQIELAFYSFKLTGKGEKLLKSDRGTLSS